MKQSMLSLTLLIALAFLSGACKQLTDLVEPKDRDVELSKYLEGGWKVDTVLYRLYDQSILSSSSLDANWGTITFGPISTELGSNYNVGSMVFQYTDSTGPVTKPLNWYSGAWGSNDISGTRMSMFMAGGANGVFTGSSAVIYNFEKRDEKRAILVGGSGSESGGIVVRSEMRWVLSR